MKRFAQPVAITLALLLATAALVLTALMFHGLLQVQQQGLAAIQETRAALAELSDQTITASVPISHTFPIQADVPLQQEFQVPIQTTIPISTLARVPIEVPLFGTRQLSVPVEAQIPVDLDVVIPIDQTIRVTTAVTLNTEVPIEFQVSELGLGEILEKLDEALLRLERGLERSLLAGQKPGEEE